MVPRLERHSSEVIAVRRHPVAWVWRRPLWVRLVSSAAPLSGRGWRSELRSRGHGDPQVPAASRWYRVARARGSSTDERRWAMTSPCSPSPSTSGSPAAERQGDVLVRRFPAVPSWTDLYVAPALARQVATRRLRPRPHAGRAHAARPDGAGRAQRAGHAVGADLPLQRKLQPFADGGTGDPMAGPAATAASVGCARSRCASMRSTQFGRRLGVQPGSIRLIRNGAGPLIVDEDAVPAVAGSPFHLLGRPTRALQGSPSG